LRSLLQSFNAEFDDACKLQKAMAIPDLELKYAIVREVKDKVLPIYIEFYETYRHVQFTKKPQKYLKYDVDGIDVALNRIFEA
jgi:exocyst complex protein 7